MGRLKTVGEPRGSAVGRPEGRAEGPHLCCGSSPLSHDSVPSAGGNTGRCIQLCGSFAAPSCPRHRIWVSGRKELSPPGLCPPDPPLPSSYQPPRIVLAPWGCASQVPAHSALLSGSPPLRFLDILKYFDNLPQLCYKFWGGVKREELRDQDPTSLPRYSTEEIKQAWVTAPHPKKNCSARMYPLISLQPARCNPVGWDPNPRF